MSRKAGRRGLRPSPHIPMLRLGNFVSLPPAPPSGDVTNGIPDNAWQMLGNDVYGDCGVAAFEHYRMAKAATAGAFEPGFVQPTTSSTESLYFAYGIAQGEPGPQPDQGVDNATFLKYLYDQGLIEGFAQIDHTNRDEVNAAMLAFNGVFTGVQLDDDAESDFEADPQIAWGSSPGDVPDPNDGHDILRVRYTPDGASYVTWGEVQPAVLAFEQQNVTDAWVVISKEDMERAGGDFSGLVAAIEAWGGTVAPAAPAPAPTPSPEAQGIVARIKAEILAEVEKVVDDVLARWFRDL